MVNRFSCLFFVLSIFVSCTFLSFGGTQDNNAAPYYIKACELLQYPEYGQAVRDTIEDIIKNGYRSKNTQIEALLKNNEPAFKELEKGVTKPKCDFIPFAKSKSFRTRIPNYWKLGDLAKLYTVKGRYYVSRSEFDKASNFYLNVITLAKHLPLQRDQLLLAKMIDVALIELVTPSIKALVQEKFVSKETLTDLNKHLQDYESHSITFVETISASKNDILNGTDGVKTWLNDIRKKPGHQRLSPSEIKLLDDQTVIEAEKLLTIYLRHYIKAAQTNQVADWDFAEKEFTKFSETASSIPSLSIYMAKSWLSSIIDKKAALKETAKILAKISVSIFMPTNFRRENDNYQKAMNGIKEVRKLIAKKIK